MRLTEIWLGKRIGFHWNLLYNNLKIFTDINCSDKPLRSVGSFEVELCC